MRSTEEGREGGREGGRDRPFYRARTEAIEGLAIDLTGQLGKAFANGVTEGEGSLHFVLNGGRKEGRKGERGREGGDG